MLNHVFSKSKCLGTLFSKLNVSKRDKDSQTVENMKRMRTSAPRERHEDHRETVAVWLGAPSAMKTRDRDVGQCNDSTKQVTLNKFGDK